MMMENDGWMIDWWWCFGFAVFLDAQSFNSDVSKWNTSRVTTMGQSKLYCLYCVGKYISHKLIAFFISLLMDGWWWWKMMDGWLIDDDDLVLQCFGAPCLSIQMSRSGTLRVSLLCVRVSCLAYTVLCKYISHQLIAFLHLFIDGWMMMMENDGWMIDWWWFGFAVFHLAPSFNSDVSKWNTSRVTNMYASKLSCLFCVVETYKPNHFFFFSSHPPTIRPPPQCFLQPMHLERTSPNGTSARLRVSTTCSPAPELKTSVELASTGQ